MADSHAQFAWLDTAAWRSLARTGAISLALQLASLGLRFAVTLLLARALGADGYGVYAFVFALVQLLTEPLANGVRRVAVRLASHYAETGEWALLQGLRRRGRQCLLAAATAVSVVIGMGGWLFEGRFGNEATGVFLAAMALPALIAVMRFHEGLLRGLGHIARGQLPGLVLRPLLLLALLAAVTLAVDITVAQAFALNALALSIALGMTIQALHRCYPRAARAVAPRYRTRAWGRSALPLIAAAALLLLQVHGATLVVGVLATSSAVAFFSTAQSVSALVEMMPYVATVVAEPRIARLHARGDHAAMARLVTRLVRGAFVLAALTAAVLYFAREPLLALFGEAFVAAAPVLGILILVQVVSIAIGEAVMILAMTDRGGYVMRANACGAALNLLATVLLVPAYGALGAAWAFLLGLIPAKLYLWWRVRRSLGIDASLLGRHRRI